MLFPCPNKANEAWQIIPEIIVEFKHKILNFSKENNLNPSKVIFFIKQNYAENKMMTRGICEIINLQIQLPRREAITGKSFKNSLHSGFKDILYAYPRFWVSETLCLASVFFLNWSIVYLQCCVNFCHIAEGFSYTYVHILFIFFSVMVYHRILNIIPCAIQ